MDIADIKEIMSLLNEAKNSENKDEQTKTMILINKKKRIILNIEHEGIEEQTVKKE